MGGNIVLLKASEKAPWKTRAICGASDGLAGSTSKAILGLVVSLALGWAIGGWCKFVKWLCADVCAGAESSGGSNSGDVWFGCDFGSEIVDELNFVLISFMASY